MISAASGWCGRLGVGGNAKHLCYARCNVAGFAVCLIGVVLCAAVPGFPQREPVDRYRGLTGAQLVVERMKVSRPTHTVIVLCQTGPILVAIVMQMGDVAGPTVAPGRED